jgi:hypothetical protein
LAAAKSPQNLGGADPAIFAVIGRPALVKGQKINFLGFFSLQVKIFEKKSAFQCPLNRKG